MFGRYLKFFLIAVVTIIFVDFSIVNHQMVTLSLFPFHYEANIAAFLLALFCLFLGTILGWVTMQLKLSQANRLAKMEHKRVMALENELQALKAEQPSSFGSTKGSPAISERSFGRAEG